MKKILALLLIAAVCLSLAGCAASAAPSAPAATDQADTPAPAPELTASPAETAAPDDMTAPEGRLCVTVRTEAEEIYTDDGEHLLLSYACPSLSVDIAGREAAAAAVNQVLDRERQIFVDGDEETDGSFTGKEFFLTGAREDYDRWAGEGMADNMIPYALLRSADVTRGDDRVLSVVFADTTYMGGAHGYTGYRGFTFDTLTGAELSLADLAEDGETFLENCARRLWELAGGAEYAARGLYDDYADYLPDLLRDNNWYFDGEGLTVIANAYEIGPYAAGTMEFTLPYEWLRWHIKPEYVPDSAADGTLSARIEEDPGATAFLADDNTGGQGAAVCFAARGRVEDVAIRRVSYMEYANFFRTDEVLWYASALEDGETLCLRTWIPDAAPNLAITWTDGSGVPRTCYISQSGKDGSLVLLPAEDFLSLPAEISALVPVEYDIDGDGERETVDLLHTETESSSQWEVLVDGEALPGTLYAWGECRLWLFDADSDGAAELYLTGDTGSEDFVSRGWRGDTRGAILFTGEDRYGKDPGERTETADGRILISGWTPVLESWNYQLGTYSASRILQLEDGVLSPAPWSRWEYRRSDRWLTVEKNLPVTMDETGQAVLLPGETIRLTGAEGDAAHFVTGEGETGILVLEYVSGEDGAGWLIDGVPEDEYFDFLPYVG